VTALAVATGLSAREPDHTPPRNSRPIV
jgi:hypothetical protein